MQFDVRTAIATLAAAALLSACGGGGSETAAPPPAAANQPPTPARLVEVSSGAVGTLSASWLPATDDSTPATAMRYQVHASTEPDFVPSSATQKTLVTGVQAVTLADGLQAGRRYTVKVVAVDQEGAASAASLALDAMVADTASIAVSGVRTQQLTATQVAAVTNDSVTLASGALAPTIGTFISSGDANSGLGFLRAVTAVNTNGGVTTLSTRRAAINEVFDGVRLSASYRLDSVPAEVAQAAANVGSRRLATSEDGSRQQSFDWPSSGLSFTTSADAAVGRRSILAVRRPSSVGGVISDGFRSSGGTTVQGQWGQISGQTRVEVNEGKSGQDTWTADITTTRVPWDSLTKVGICRVGVGPVRGGGSTGRPDLVSVSTETFAALETDTGNRIARASQVFKFEARAGAGSDEPYRVKLTAYLDDAGDGCVGDNLLATWREQVHLEVLVMVTQDTFPTQESNDAVFDGSAGFSITNRVVTSFSPKLTLDHEISGARLQSARISVSASPVLEQTLTLTAAAQGTMDVTKTIVQPRSFRKVYITPAGIPVIISGTFKVRLRIQGDASGQLDATEVLRIGYDQVSFGVEYRNGQFVPISSATPEYSLRIAGQGQAQANLTLTLLPMLEIKAWEAISAQAVLAPSMTAGGGVEGHVRLDAAVNFDGEPQLVTAADADYRLTRTDLAAALDVYLYADFSLFDNRLLVYPDTNPDPSDYLTFKRVQAMEPTALMALPELRAFLPDGPGSIHPTNTQLLKVRATAGNLPNPLYQVFPSIMEPSFLPWVAWTPTKLVAPFGAVAGSYGLAPDPTGEPGVSWVRITKPGRYVVRAGGYSKLGTWARQYVEVVVDVFDENQNGIPDWWEGRYGLQGSSGAAIAQADPDGDGLTNLQEWEAGTDPTVAEPAVARLNVDSSPTTVLQAVRLWVSEALQRVASVVWNFGAGVAEQTVAVVNGVSAAVTQAFDTEGVRTFVATLSDAAGAVVGRLSGQIDVVAAGPQVEAVLPPTAVAGVQTTFVATGRNLPTGLRFQLPGCADVAEAAGGSTSERSFTCRFPVDTPAGSVDGTVALSDSPFGGAPLKAFTVNVLRSSIGEVSPSVTTRSIATSFDISGQNLPVIGVSVVPLNDTRSNCQEPNNVRATGFGVACELYKVGPQQLEVRAGGQVLGTVTVNITSNVSGVSWTSPSTNSSGTVRFGESVTYIVRGSNLLADPTMGFAVERCGVSNTEVGVPTATERSFSCTFNDQAGAVAGLMPGVVKDSPGGQVLLEGWGVPVEVASTGFFDDFVGTSLDTTKWTVASNGGIPATLSLSGGYLNVAVPGGSCGSCGVSDGSTLTPIIAPLAADFTVEMGFDELSRASRDGSAALSTIQMVLYAGTSTQVGVYAVGDARSNTGQAGHLIHMYSVTGGTQDIINSRELTVGQYESLKFRIRRSAGQIYLAHKLNAEATWTEVAVRQTIGATTAFTPKFIFASGDGGGTRINSSMSARVDYVRIDLAGGGGEPLTTRLFDSFEASTLDAATWGSTTGGYSVEAGGLILSGGDGRGATEVKTAGKVTFSGSRIEVSALITPGDPAGHDTHLSLVEEGGPYIGMGDTTLRSPQIGFYGNAAGQYNIPGTYISGGASSTDPATMRMVVDGDMLTVSRTRGTVTETVGPVRLGSSIVGRVFYLKIGHYSWGGTPPRPARVDWVEVKSR